MSFLSKSKNNNITVEKKNLQLVMMMNSDQKYFELLPYSEVFGSINFFFFWQSMIKSWL